LGRKLEKTLSNPLIPTISFQKEKEKEKEKERPASKDQTTSSTSHHQKQQLKQAQTTNQFHVPSFSLGGVHPSFVFLQLQHIPGFNDKPRCNFDSVIYFVYLITL